MRNECVSKQKTCLKFNFAGREGLILHDHCAAAGQDHYVQILLLLVSLLIPVAGHLCVMSRDQGHLDNKQAVTYKSVTFQLYTLYLI